MAASPRVVEAAASQNESERCRRGFWLAARSPFTCSLNAAAPHCLFSRHFSHSSLALAATFLRLPSRSIKLRPAKSAKGNVSAFVKVIGPEEEVRCEHLGLLCSLALPGASAEFKTLSGVSAESQRQQSHRGVKAVA